MNGFTGLWVGPCKLQVAKTLSFDGKVSGNDFELCPFPLFILCVIVTATFLVVG